MAVSSSSMDLGQGSVPRLLLRMAIPTVVAQLITMLYNVVDRIYIGHIRDTGTLALTGVGLCLPVLMLLNAFASLAGAGGAPRAAIAMGQKQNENAEKILGNCFTALILFAAVLTVSLFAAAEPLLRLFGASDQTLPFALSYMRIYLCGSVFVLIVLGMTPFLTTQGFTKFTMMCTVIGAVINIILDPILIFLFHMGVQGAAYATIFSQMVSAIFVLRFLTGKKTILKLKASNLAIRPSVLLPCLALGASPFVMMSTESLLNISFNSSLARYGGDIAVGSMTIISSVSQLVTLPLNGVCQGGQPIISYNFGAGKRDRVKKAFWCQFLVCVGFTTLFWAAVMTFPRVFAGIFSNNAELLDHTAWTMRIYMAGIFSLGFQLSCQQAFMALGQAKISLLMACLRKLVLLIPLIFVLPLFLENKVFAVFLAEPISDIIAATITSLTFFTQFSRILKKGSSKI